MDALQEKLQAEVREELLDPIAEFASYLNDEGFSVTEEDILRSAGMFRTSGADFLNDSDAETVFRIAFSKNRDQYRIFPEKFRNFLKCSETIHEHSRNRKELQEKKKLAEDQNASDAGKLSLLEEKEHETRRKAEEEWAAKPLLELDKKSGKLLERCRKEFRFESHLLKDLTAGTVSKGQSREDIQKASAELMKHAEKAILSGNRQKTKDAQDLMKLLVKYQEAIQNGDRAKQEFLKEKLKEVSREKSDILSRQKKRDEELRKMERTQAELDKKMAKLHSSPLVQKNESVSHRSDFRTSGGSVQSRAAGIPDSAETAFESLSEKDRKELRSYLKENVLKFRTRLTQHIDEMDLRHIDIGETIRSACRAGGIPMVLHYQKPHAGKADLMLVLDVSGSCKNASRMMLTFMFMLKEAFPHGVKAFAFVNSLYDISGLMDTKDDIDASISKILGTIPTRGVYSDYSRPIQTLKNRYASKVTGDTILIFMGDARNNQNSSMETEFKFLCRKAKRAYWLNTEPISKWDTADSIAETYGRYAKMYEAINTAELIDFVSTKVR